MSAIGQPAASEGMRTFLSGIEDLRALGHEADAAEHDELRVGLGRELRENERVAEVVGHPLDVVNLVVVAEDDGVLLALQFLAAGDEFGFGQRRVLVEASLLPPSRERLVEGPDQELSSFRYLEFDPQRHERHAGPPGPQPHGVLLGRQYRVRADLPRGLEDYADIVVRVLVVIGQRELRQPRSSSAWRASARSPSGRRCSTGPDSRASAVPPP